MKLLVTLAALMIVPALASDATTNELCHGFVPANTMQIPVNANDYSNQWSAQTGTGGIDEKTFNDVMDKMEKLYNAEIQSHGATLKINRLWSNATVNASAQQQGKTWVLNMYGGLARNKVITRDAMFLVACHEMGHHLGGAPKFSSWGGSSSWGTVEGGADYYAVLKCMRRVFADEDNDAATASLNIDTMAKSGCDQQFTDAKDAKMCYRSTMAGMAVAQLFQQLSNESTAPAFGTPDKSIVKVMFEDHPATQCRLDTYFEGALCDKKVTDLQSNTDYHTGSCAQDQGAKVGFRPLCWFAPGTHASDSPNFIPQDRETVY